MKFKIINIEIFSDHNKYDCLFTCENIEKQFSTYIGKPEIESPKCVLQILCANCDAEFGGNGIITQGSSIFENETEIKTDFYYVI